MQRYDAESKKIGKRSTWVLLLPRSNLVEKMFESGRKQRFTLFLNNLKKVLLQCD